MILSASHVVITPRTAPYVVGAATPFTWRALAISRIETHLPYPPHGSESSPADTQSKRWQDSPEKPLRHVHFPFERSQSPRLEHSAGACAMLAADGSSHQARPYGHVRSEQSPDVYPSKQVHRKSGEPLHVPWSVHGVDPGHPVGVDAS